MLFVASVQDDPPSHALVGPVCTVVAVVGKVSLAPSVKVVDVAVMLQPAPEPVPSPTSSACVAVTVWLVPFSVSVKLTLGGGLTKARDPGRIVAVAVAAPAGSAGQTAAPHSATAPATHSIVLDRRAIVPPPTGLHRGFGAIRVNLRYIGHRPCTDGDPGQGDPAGGAPRGQVPQISAGCVRRSERRPGPAGDGRRPAAPRAWSAQYHRPRR